MVIASFYKRLRIKREYAALFIVLAIAFFLRLYHLGFRDFWYDEVCSFYYAQHPLRNWNPPLYWILLHFWIKVFGASEFSLRFPSLLFSLISVFLVYLLGKRLFSPRVGIYAAVFMAFSPFHIQYAQEARPYTLSLFLSALSTYLLYRSLTEKQDRYWLGFVLVSIAGFYSNINYYHIFLFIAQVLCALIILEKNDVRKISYFLFPLLSFMFWLPKFFLKFNWINSGAPWWWMPRPDFEAIHTTIKNFSFGCYASLPSILCQIFYLCIFSILFLSLAILINKKERRMNLTICLLLFVIPVALIFIISRIILPVYYDRCLIVFSPYYYLILAVGLSRMNRKWIEGPLILFFVLLCFSGIGNYYVRGDVKKHFRQAVNFIEDNAAAGDMVSYASPAAMSPFVFYNQNKKRLPHTKFVISEFLNNDSLLLSANRIWFIACPWGSDFNRDLSDDANTLAALHYLDKNFRQEFFRKFDDGLEVFRYVKP